MSGLQSSAVLSTTCVGTLAASARVDQRGFDEDDRRYLDFTAGIGVTSTGHCHPRVVEAATRQIETLIHAQYTTVMHRPLLDLVDRMGEVLPDGLDRMFFANSGSEAIEAALRLARQAMGRPNIIAFHGGFHGRTVPPPH